MVGMTDVITETASGSIKDPKFPNAPADWTREDALKTAKKAGLTLGISTHDHEELEIALRHKPDYVALGPIYETTLKKMPFAPQGLDRIGEWKKLIGKIPLVAIGGIKLEQAAAIFEAGADSIAVVSDVTQHFNPNQRVHDWLALTRA